jgi:hypothetical protein
VDIPAALVIFKKEALPRVLYVPHFTLQSEEVLVCLALLGFADLISL